MNKQKEYEMLIQEEELTQGERLYTHRTLYLFWYISLFIFTVLSCITFNPITLAINPVYIIFFTWAGLGFIATVIYDYMNYIVLNDWGITIVRGSLRYRLSFDDINVIKIRKKSFYRHYFKADTLEVYADYSLLVLKSIKNGRKIRVNWFKSTAGQFKEVSKSLSAHHIFTDHAELWNFTETLAKNYLEMCEDVDCIGDKSVGIGDCPYYSHPDVDEENRVTDPGGCQIARKFDIDLCKEKVSNGEF